MLSALLCSNIVQYNIIKKCIDLADENISVGNTYTAFDISPLLPIFLRVRKYLSNITLKHPADSSTQATVEGLYAGECNKFLMNTYRGGRGSLGACFLGLPRLPLVCVGVVACVVVGRCAAGGGPPTGGLSLSVVE